jgi:hypothetical protein
LCFGLLCAQSTKTIHQTFPVDNASKIVLNVVGTEIDVRETKGSRVLVETTVRLSISNDRLLDYVVNSNRYDLIKTIDPLTKELVLSSPKGNNMIIVKGKEVMEEVSYVFYLPTALRYANISTIKKNSKE